MNCEDVSMQTPLYLAGDLDPVRMELFAAHLNSCPACACELGQQAALDASLRASMRAEQIDTTRVDRHIRRQIAPQAASHNTWRWLLAAAGVAVLVTASFFGIRVFSARTKPVYAAAAKDHRWEIVDGQPRKWLTDRASIEALGARQGVSDSAIAAIAPAGYRLVEGKLCRLDGRIFLHLVYANGLANFSVFLRRPDDKGPAATNREIQVATQGAEHIAGFDDARLSALIVTEQSGNAALAFAKSAAAVL
jgi:anti-sigma factor RsiW